MKKVGYLFDPKKGSGKRILYTPNCVNNSEEIYNLVGGKKGQCCMTLRKVGDRAFTLLWDEMAAEKLVDVEGSVGVYYSNDNHYVSPSECYPVNSIIPKSADKCKSDKIPNGGGLFWVCGFGKVLLMAHDENGCNRDMTDDDIATIEGSIVEVSSGACDSVTRTFLMLEA